ncbi:MAG: Nramp family divalent metal transporter [Candidatus Peribacteraceae bacterium]|jgi:NRAMP (natural resistance-associated macrophage protein)-like metal ion transporter
MKRRKAWLEKTEKFFREHIGPGVITGASDDDPSGIATYAQAGAKFGYGMLWTTLFMFPLMVVIQEISGRIGRVTGKGIAANLRQYYPRWLLHFSVGLLLMANTINIGADLGAMGEAVELLLGVPSAVTVVFFSLVCVYLAVFLPYKKYVPILQWLVLALFAYVITAFVTDIPWKDVAFYTLIPNLSLNKESLAMIIAILGTTISPYLFFWQSSQEVEEIRAHRFLHALIRFPLNAKQELWKLRVDTVVGMAFSNIIAFFIILTTAATLNASGLTTIETAADAAQALRPLAGSAAAFLFAAGIVGTGLLAVPVLAASAAFGVGEAMRWPVGLERNVHKAKGFYGVLTAATVMGLLLNFFGINPIDALIASAVVNGIVSVPLMAALVHMSSNEKVMGSLVIPKSLRIAGWVTTAVVATAGVGFFLTW